MSSFNPSVASSTVVVHAVLMFASSVLEGIYASAIAGFGGWTYIDGSDQVAGMLMGGYGLFRLFCFVGGAISATLVLLSANSLRVGQRRFLVAGGLAGLLMPFLLLSLNLFTFNFCCSIWFLPALSAIPAAVVTFDALPTAPPSPPREEW